MTRHPMIHATALMLLAGLTLPLAAQHERREEGRPEHPRGGHAQPDRGREQAPPMREAHGESHPSRDRESFRPGDPPVRSERPDRSGPPRERREAPEGFRPPAREPSRPQTRELRPPQHTREAARTWQAREPWRRDAWPAHSSWREHRARHWEHDHRTWAQRGGYGGYRIPEPLFAARFGNRHPFILQSRPVIYQGYPRFRCGGYSFLIVDPWPEFWLDDWYRMDEVYIDYYLDGYYLFNPRYPGIRVAVTVLL